MLRQAQNIVNSVNKLRTLEIRLKVIANRGPEPLEPEIQKPSLNARTFGTGSLKAIAIWKLELLKLKVQKSLLKASPNNKTFLGLEQV